MKIFGIGSQKLQYYQVDSINGCHCVKLKIRAMYSTIKKTYDSQSEKAHRSYRKEN